MNLTELKKKSIAELLAIAKEMGLDNMAKLAHSLEDMFFIIREEKPKMTSVESLYELVFLASDLLKAEIEIVQNDDYQNTDFSSEIAKITNCTMKNQK